MTQVTFEDGDRRLQGIAERLNSDEVPVHEMCDLFAEGTGLHQALTGYLREQKARVEAIERGEGVQPFRIVAPGTAPAAEPRATAPAGSRSDDGPRTRASQRDDGPLVPVADRDPPRPEARPARDAPPTLGADDDIPF